jgi:hypothetical protein
MLPADTRSPITSHHEAARGARLLWRVANADYHAANVLPVIREIQRSGASLHEIADALNARGIGTPRGGHWYAKVGQTPWIAVSFRRLRTLSRIGLGQQRARRKHSYTYSITSSAVARSEGGTVRPSILAVWWLMTSSNFVACNTGRSAGLAPFRTRPV